jgi:hypothetical protein
MLVWLKEKVENPWLSENKEIVNGTSTGLYIISY